MSPTILRGVLITLLAMLNVLSESQDVTWRTVVAMMSAGGLALRAWIDKSWATNGGK